MLTDIEIVERLMADARENVEQLEYNENISGVPEIKIMFNAYGDDDESGENQDKNIETYFMFVHKNALDNGFEFPRHDLFRGSIIRGADEIYIPAVYNVDEDYWDINFLEFDDNSAIDEEKLNEILQGLYRKYYC